MFLVFYLRCLECCIFMFEERVCHVIYTFIVCEGETCVMCMFERLVNSIDECKVLKTNVSAL